MSLVNAKMSSLKEKINALEIKPAEEEIKVEEIVEEPTEVKLEKKKNKNSHIKKYGGRSK